MRHIGCILSTLVLASSVSAMTPGGVRKKFIALNFDTMFNAPSNVFAHAEALNAVPWLDGIAVSLRDVPVKTLDGRTETSSACSAASAALYTGTLGLKVFKVLGSRRVKNAVSSISGF